MTVTFSDNFNRSNGSLGSDWSSDGDVTVNSNALRNSATYPNIADKVAELPGDDWTCDLTFASALSNGVVQLLFRADSTRDNDYRVTWSASEIMFEVDNGAGLPSGGYAGGSFGAATTARVVCSGADFEVWVGGSKVIDITDTTHAGGSGSRYVSLRLSNPTPNAHGVTDISFDDGASGGSPQTWSGSAATVALTGVSGSFTPGSVVWSGSTATVALTGVSGSFTPGSVVWSGSAATVALTGVSGSFTPGSVVWSGSTATVTLTALSGSFTEGDRPGADFWSTVAIGSGAISVVSGVAYSCFANGYEFCVFEPDTAVALNRWSTGARTNLTQPNVMTDATASAFHRHEMAYLSTGLLDYRLDGASIVSATNSAHVAASKSLYIGQGHSSTSSRWGGRTDVEWVGVRTYDGVDSVQTVGAETAT